MSTSYRHLPHAFVAQSGKVIDLANPTPGMGDIEDIAHALSNICRFGGHVPGHYSVAEHSLLVCGIAGLLAQELRIQPGATRTGLLANALLHDASEAYLGDVISPLKSLLGGYKELEHRVQCCILKGLIGDASYFQAADAEGTLVKRADVLAFIYEWQAIRGLPVQDLMGTGIDEEQIAWVQTNLMPLDIPRLGCSADVKQEFLKYYRHFKSQMGA